MPDLADDGITQRVIERAKQLSGNRIPVDVEEIARSCGVVEIAPRAIPFDGYLARRPDGCLAIRYSAESSPRRIRFTVAHEIGHLIIADETNCPLDGMVARGPNRSSTVERLANRFASEALMPGCSFTKFLREEPLSWNLIRGIADIFKVSKEVVLRRLMELDDFIGFEIRIPFGVKPHKSATCNFSIRNRIFLGERPEQLYGRLLSEMNSRSMHSVELVTMNDVNITIPVFGRVVSESESRVYRLVGIVCAKSIES